MARANFKSRGRFAFTIASRDRTLFHQKGIFSEPISKRSRNPNCKAWRTNGSGIIVKLITPFDSAAKRSGLPPAVMILASLSGSIPSRLSAKRRPRSEVLPMRLTPPILPLSCSGRRNILCRDDVIDEGADHAENHHRIRPANRELTSVATEVAETSISPASRACRHDRARADGYDLGIDGVFLQQPLFLQHPDGRVGRTRTGPGDADFFLGENGADCLQQTPEAEASLRSYEHEHNFRLSAKILGTS